MPVDIATGALAAALLYGMYKITSVETDRAFVPDTGRESDREMERQLRSSGIPTHMLTRANNYVAERNFSAQEREIAYNGPEGIVPYCRKVLQDLKEVYSQEIRNDRDYTFLIPSPSIKPTIIETYDDALPGVSDAYVYQYVRKPLRKIGRAEDPY